ncbi:DUF4185 domain-containing protein [Sunxiuqinia sp. sy24]|uniref:DUF4185 domain-containing protein n=1 Tax=Sunxiuqinia sp. sy24 TaxID=3461495 RepID=UPI0040456A17
MRIWNDTPPFFCPFEQSDAFSSIGFTGDIWAGGNADTFYPSWGKDGNLYSCFTDGSVDGVSVSSRGNPQSNVAYLTIQGNNPKKLKFTDHGIITHTTTPYIGRYPSACLVYNDNWYIGTYSLDDLPHTNYGTLGGFVGFHVSTDLGKTWEQCPHTPDNALFGETGKRGNSVKIGAPHFVDFGKNMEHSPDGKAYLVSHGSSLPDTQPRYANNSWITGDQIYLCRVSPQPDKVNNSSAYEFFAGKDTSGMDIWSKDFNEIKPIADWNNNMGCVTITYNAPLKKYFMCVTDGQTTLSRYNSYILESDKITGPWRMVSYMKDFGEMGYFLNIPSKFISKDGKTMWLCYSANWINIWQNRTIYQDDPKGSSYSMTLVEIKLID